MEYQIRRTSGVLLLLSFIVLGGCEAELDPSDMQIIGVPPAQMYYDAEYTAEFGVTGGDGFYSYRYVQNPESDDRPEGVDPHDIELTVEEANGAKAAFKINGIPELPEDGSVEPTGARQIFFGLEASDGNQTVREEYEVSLDKNRLNATQGGSGDIRTTEGISIDAGETLYQTRVNRVDADLTADICSETRVRMEKSVEDGQEYYSSSFRVELDANVAKKVELFYRVKSNYDENAPERSEKNIGIARPGVDFREVVKSFTLEPGERICVVSVDIFEDNLIEGPEQFILEFFDRKGALVDFEQLVTVEIADNEPDVIVDFEPRTVSPGDTVTQTVRMTKPSNKPVSINIVVDTDASTAPESLYTLVPESGVLNFEPGQQEASFSVVINDLTTQERLTRDPFITLGTDINDILEIDPLEITVNQWPLGRDIDNEIVADDSDVKAVDMAIDGDGVVHVLLEDNSGPTTEAVIKAFDSQGTPLELHHASLGDAFELRLSDQASGVNVVPVALDIRSGAAVSGQGSEHNLYVVANVDGLTASGGAHRGGQDFVVASYTREGFGPYLDGENAAASMRQFGTEGDDIVSGAQLGPSDFFYIFGSTSGTVFDGAPGFETNNGGKDGFVYKLDSESSQNPIWKRFVGTENDDNVEALSIGRRDILVLVQEMNSDIDGFTRNLQQVDGRDNPDATDGKIVSRGDDNVVDIAFSGTGVDYGVLLNSLYDPESGELTPSITEDVFLAQFSVEGDSVSQKTEIASDGNDFAKKVLVISDEDSRVVIGDTRGVFSGNSAKGSQGRDGFLVSLDEDTSGIAESIKQFGTPGDDRVIDIEEVNDRKVMVLWQENHTSADGRIRYRVSPFSREGDKLTADPQ